MPVWSQNIELMATATIGELVKLFVEQSNLQCQLKGQDAVFGSTDIHSPHFFSPVLYTLVQPSVFPETASADVCQIKGRITKPALYNLDLSATASLYKSGWGVAIVMTGEDIECFSDGSSARTPKRTKRPEGQSFDPLVL